MTEVFYQEAIAQLVAILDEAFAKPPGHWHHFTDVSPDSGYYGTLAKLSSEVAGQAVAETSVADQVSHVIFVLNTAAQSLSLDAIPPGQDEWRASWQAGPLDEATWQKLQLELRGAYDRLRESILFHGVKNAEVFAAIVGTIAHVAYHLGAIKQKVAVLKSSA